MTGSGRSSRGLDGTRGSAALIRASEKWRGLHVTLFESRQLDAIRKEIDHTHSQSHAPAVKQSAAKSPSCFSSRNRT